jgi:hypothetical protein
MEESPPLPYCCKCHLDLSKTELRGLSCDHAYCRQCALNTFTCLICAKSTTALASPFQGLPMLYNAYRDAPTAENYAKMFEVINVNDVECPKGSNCLHRSWCKYTHAAVVMQDEDSWHCTGCNIKVKKGISCPMCGAIPVLQPSKPASPKPAASASAPAFPPQVSAPDKVSEGKKSSSWWDKLCFCDCCHSRKKDNESKPLLSPQKSAS